ncbi:ABC transporter permease subunit [Thermogutta sp.]|uniref:ABC transporter permease subunit n=1 Tax=Thermogutta sp. TaxID=1962930 RepID=UPI003C79F1BB
MFAGPILTREMAVCPRRWQFFLARTAYAAILLLLMCTAWLVVTGTQYIRDVGDAARFSETWFQIASPMQLVLAIFSAALVAASSVCQEKDKRTLDLLLVTELTNTELVLGKLFSSLVTLLTTLVGGIPVYLFAALLGGISYGQIFRVFLVTFAAMLVAGSLGTLLAFWREKTVQAITLTILALVFWLGIGEVLAWQGGRVLVGMPCSSLAVMISPWRAVLEASRPILRAESALGTLGFSWAGFLIVELISFLVLNGIAIAGVRVWNVVRDPRRQPAEEDWATGAESQALEPALAAVASTEASASASEIAARGPAYPGVVGVERAPVLTPTDRRSKSAEELSRLHAAPGKKREVWDNPVLWREVCTWAYGRRALLVRLGYLVLFFAAFFALAQYGETIEGPNKNLVAAVTVPVLLISLILVNTQAVTSLTTERDGRTLDLLLVSDITPKEFIFGKLLGTFYNCKEYVLLPTILCLWLGWRGWLTWEDTVYLVVGLWVLFGFVAMLGVHAGLNYVNSRHAIATSLGTVFFLFLGVAVCMRVMLAFSGSFQAQLHPFLAFMIGGGAGLYLALGIRNPSNALALASFACPLATFYALTSLFLGQTHLVFVALVAAYSFATAAMLIPAIDEFDVATGRTTADET